MYTYQIYQHKLGILAIYLERIIVRDYKTVFEITIQSWDSRQDELHFLGRRRPPPTQKLESVEAS